MFLWRWIHKGYDVFLKTHGFTGKTKTVELHPNLAGYNMSTVGIEKNGGMVLIEETHVIPPDDWGGIAIVTDKELSDYYPLIAIADIKDTVERCALEYDIRNDIHS